MGGRLLGLAGFLLALSFCLILQGTFFSEFRLFGAAPDLVLVIVVSLTFFQSKEASLGAAALGGLMEDLYLGVMLGSNLLALSLSVYLVTAFSTRIIRENVITPLLVIFLSSLSYYVIMGILLILSGQGFLMGPEYLGDMLFGSLYNMILGILIYPITYLIFHQIRKEPL